MSQTTADALNAHAYLLKKSDAAMPLTDLDQKLLRATLGTLGLSSDDFQNDVQAREQATQLELEIQRLTNQLNELRGRNQRAFGIDN